jgi:hypothetical protein
LRRTRKAIENFEWHTSIQEAKAVIGPALSFALDFASRELQGDLAYGPRDDTWDQLILELGEFGAAHVSRLAVAAGAIDENLIGCDHCGQWSIPDHDSRCLLCGHWNADSGHIPF